MQPLYGKILVPVRSNRCFAAGPYAYGLVRATGGELVLLHVQHGPEDPREVESCLTEMERCARARGIPVRVIRQAGPLAETIREVAQRLPADLVILSRRADSHELDQILAKLGEWSQTEGAPCPIMIVPTFATAPTESKPPGSGKSARSPEDRPDWHWGA